MLFLRENILKQQPYSGFNLLPLSDKLPEFSGYELFLITQNVLHKMCNTANFRKNLGYSNYICNFVAKFLLKRKYDRARNHKSTHCP